MEFDNFGVMIDVSRNAVASVDTIKKIIDFLEKMEYNTLELYAEDTYKVDDEPYFGYQRGGYSGEEIQEIDNYAKLHGIELIPCIQTLAHFTNLVKLPHYRDIVDLDDILLIDSDKTYELIEKMFKTISKNFSSRKINIGMDEAHMVGLGKYLEQNGYKNRFDLLNKHLRKVCEIAKKYGFKPHMWSDMYFRLATNGNYVVDELEFDKSIIDGVPENVELAYWDYFNDDTNVYDTMFSIHRQFNKEIWFAGGAWVWTGFAPNNYFSLKTMKSAMKSVSKNDIQKVLITLWGDNSKECSFFAALPSLYAIRQYSKGNFDEDNIKNGFEELFGYRFDDFMTLDLPNYCKTVVQKQIIQNPCKIFLYEDCFMGIFDNVKERDGKIPYGDYAQKIFEAGKRTKDFKYIFDCLGNLCLVLDKKMMLGIETRKLYRDKDKRGLLKIVDEYSQLGKLLNKFYKSFKTLWFTENKPFGFEIQDVRLGGLIQRVKTCKERITDYLNGKVESIPELEEDVLDYNGGNLHLNIYARMISRSSLCYENIRDNV